MTIVTLRDVLFSYESKEMKFCAVFCIDLDSISTLHFSYRGRIPSVGRALDCRAEDRGFDSRGRTITHGLKIAERNEGTLFALRKRRDIRVGRMTT